MIEWPRLSVYCSAEYRELRREIRNPGPGTPKAWAYPWCVLNSRLQPYLVCVDLGCGTTNFIEHINRITKTLAVGLDLRTCPNDVRDVRFVSGDISNIEFPDNFFDRVFSISVLEHVPLTNRKQVCDEMFRVLKPGGLAVITIDHVFHISHPLLHQLTISKELAKIGSNFYGNYDFHQLISDYSHIAEPLEPLDALWVPGSPYFDEERVLADEDILVREATDISDVRLFTYTTVGIIFHKYRKT